MKKRLILIILIIISLISIVNAGSITYNYNSNDVNLFIYPCNDPTCGSLGSNLITKSTNSGSIFTGEFSPVSNNLEYHFSANYLPKEAKRDATWYPTDPWPTDPWPISFSKQSSCASSLSAIQITGILQPNNQLTITSIASTPFLNLYHPSSFIPTGYDSYYEALTTITFSKKGPSDSIYQPISTLSGQRITLSGKPLSFTYIPTAEGTYNFRIDTRVTDQKCSSYNDQFQEKTISISIPTCTPLFTQCVPINYNPCYMNNSIWIQNRTCSDVNRCDSQHLNRTEFINCQNITQIINNTINATGADCEGGIKNNYCGLNGRLCQNGNYIDKCSLCGCSSGYECKNDKCTSKNTCTPEWQCTGWGRCINNARKQVCVDKNMCGNNIGKPAEEEYCTITINEKSSDQTKTSETTITNQPSTIKFEMGSGLYWLIGLIIVVLAVLSSFLYYINKPKGIKKAVEVKEELKKVNVSDLLSSTINSLGEEEKIICNKLIEGEGIKQDDLRKIVGLTKPRMEVALSKLERRQIIKEREWPENRIYFNDQLKE